MALGALLLGPQGAIYHLDYLAFPTAKNDFSHIWLKFDHDFEEIDETSIFSMPPPPHYRLLNWATLTCYPPQGPNGPPWELSWTTCILHLRRYLHTKELVCTTSGSGEEDRFEIYTVLALGALPQGANLRFPNHSAMARVLVYGGL